MAQVLLAKSITQISLLKIVRLINRKELKSAKIKLAVELQCKLVVSASIAHLRVLVVVTSDATATTLINAFLLFVERLPKMYVRAMNS